MLSFCYKWIFYLYFSERMIENLQHVTQNLNLWFYIFWMCLVVWMKAWVNVIILVSQLHIIWTLDKAVQWLMNCWTQWLELPHLTHAHISIASKCCPWEAMPIVIDKFFIVYYSMHICEFDSVGESFMCIWWIHVWIYAVFLEYKFIWLKFILQVIATVQTVFWAEVSTSCSFVR